jgi:hypothetical protein
MPAHLPSSVGLQAMLQARLRLQARASADVGCAAPAAQAGSFCDTRPFAPLPARTPGRHRIYHDRLVAMIRAEEAKLVEYLQTITRDLERRIEVRKRKHQWSSSE